MFVDRFMRTELGSLTSIKTGKLDANASSENGIYPFFTCAVEPLKIDSYSYDCECVLVAGNGDLNVKYYNGKFDAYQRTYIIESKDKSKLTVPYLYYFLESYIETLRNQSIGGIIKYIKLGNLTNAPIPVLSIKEQNEIVKTLDKVKSIITHIRTQLEKLDLLVKARFVEMFGSIHESNNYPYIPVKELTTVISGGTPNREKPLYWNNGTIPWIKTTELQNNIITSSEEYITQTGLDESSAKLVPPKTILIAMYGQGRTRGMTAYLNIEASTNQACACILPSNKINSIFLWKYFQLSYDKLRNMAKGGNQPNLNGNIIKNFPVLLPPINKQEEYVTFVKQVDQSKSILQQELTQTQTLFDSLMQEYFG